MSMPAPLSFRVTLPITRRFALCSLIVFLLAANAHGAAVAGRVRDKDANTSLLGATVTLPELNRSTTSDSGGQFAINNLPAGTYTLNVSYVGFLDFTDTVTIADDGRTRVDVPLASDSVTLAEFLVEGTREGQSRALQQKRSASNIIDVLSADAVGKFPDGNAAEALRRVPGITVEIDQDEGRYVVVRGIDSSLNTVTLNNQLVGTPSEGGNRGVALDSVPADLIARVEVTKAVTPEMDGHAIGGSINIVTQSAFDRPEGFLSGTIAGFYDRFSDRTTPNGSITFGRVFGADRQWGVVAAVSYSLKDYKSQTVNTRSWANNTSTGNVWLPLSQQSYDYDIERERIGANLALQYRPADGHEFALRLNHNEFSDSEDRQSTEFEYRRGTLSNQTATSGSNSQGRATREFRDYEQTGTIDAASLDGKHELADGTELRWQVGASRGERDTGKRNDWEYRSSASAFPNTYDLSGEELVITPVAAYYDPAQYPFRRVRFRTDLEQEDVFSAQADLRRALQMGTGNGFWKVGAKLVSRDKEDDRENANYNLASGASNRFTLGEPVLAGTEPENYFDGLFRFGPTIDVDANEAFFAANPGRFAYDPIGSLENSLASDFEASEDVLAGYAMTSFDLAPGWNLLAGVRVERTEADYAANELRTIDGDFSGDYSRVTGSTSYTDVLPGIHLVWRPTEQTVVRAAWTNTVGRPNYEHLAPRREFDSIETATGSGVYIGSLSTGNPDLQPYESMNFDLSFEYYLKNTGIVSLGAFHKRIDNPIYGYSFFETDVTVDGRFYSQLSTSRPENADSGRITGLEFNYQQFFTFLPAPFDGFGVMFNYTVTDSEAKLFERSDKVPFFKQADWVANAALFYERNNWEIRVAWSHTDDYLSDVGGGTDTDIYIRSRSPIDAKISYRVNRQLKVFAEFLNLNEEPLREFTGIAQRENDFEIYQWKAKFGFTFNL